VTSRNLIYILQPPN